MLTGHYHPPQERCQQCYPRTAVGAHLEHVVQELPLGQGEFLDIVGPPRGKGIFPGMLGQGPNTLLVVGERGDGAGLADVVHADGLIVRPRYHLCTLETLEHSSLSHQWWLSSGQQQSIAACNYADDIGAWSGIWGHVGLSTPAQHCCP